MQALLDFADANPNPRVDIALFAYWHREFQLVIRQIGEIAARIKRTARSTADIAACAELACKIGAQNSGSDGAVLERGRVVVERDEGRESPACVGEHFPDGGNSCLRKNEIG